MKVLSLVSCAVIAPACGSESPIPDGGVGIVLDIPNKALDPKGYTSVEVTMHGPTGDVVRSASVSSNGFSLGDLDIVDAVWVEAVLRNDSGTAVGYGRTAGPVDLEPNATVTIQIRRPILYLAGMDSEDPDGDPDTLGIVWSSAATTFDDLSSGAVLDGSTQLASSSTVMVSAGPDLFSIQQAPIAGESEEPDPAKNVMGSASIVPISTGDHAAMPALAGTLSGGVRDGVGSDDGAWLVIGTTTNLYVVHATDGSVKSVATGDFGRVALVTTADGPTTAIAIKNRGSAVADLVTVSIAGGEIADAKTIASGAWSDVASDGGRMFAVDSTKGELDEIVGTTVKKLRGGLVHPTALAVSNGQAFIGSETTQPIGLAIYVASIAGSESPHALWTEAQTQVAEASMYPGVQRVLTAEAATFGHLEVGAGGDYVAASSAAVFHGDAVFAARFPELDINTEELRVFDASSGAPIQRYRSYCDGTILSSSGDITGWRCATTNGQTSPTASSGVHHIQSMTYLFGKK